MSKQSSKRPLDGGIGKFFVVRNVEAAPTVCDSASEPVAKRARVRLTGFNPDWEKDFKWVEEMENGMRCKLCVLHQKRPKRAAIGKATWVDVPCTYLVRDSLCRHERSECHQEAMAFEASRTLKTRTIVASVEHSSSLAKLAWVGAFRILYWLAKREIPHTTNYKHLLELCKDMGVSVLNNLKRGENDKSESERFIQDAILTIGRQVQAPILQDLQQSPWYSIMIDETTDIQVVNEMIVYGRYLKDGQSRTEFLRMIPLRNGTAATIMEALLDFLQDINLPLKKMCAIGSDGASVMVGKKNGVGAKLRELVPHILSNHCVAHRLALAVGQSTKDIAYLKTFKSVLDQLHRFYKYSSVRTAALHQIQELYDDKTLKLTQAKDVRWLSHDLATNTLRKCFPAVVSSLEREAQERDDAQALGLATFVKSYKFIGSLLMMCDVLPHMSALSKAMQTRDAVYTVIRPLVNGTISIIQQLKAQPGEHYGGMDDTITKLQDQQFDVRRPTESQMADFHTNVYTKFLNNIENNLRDRFPDLPMIEHFGQFNTAQFPDDEEDLASYANAEMKTLASHFHLDEQRTELEWRQVKAAIRADPAKTSMAPEKTMEWIAGKLETSHPNMFQIAAIGLLLPTSTADCERGFSTLKRVKTEHRSTLSNKVLNSLIAVSVQGPSPADMDYDKCVEDWHKSSNRRTSL